MEGYTFARRDDTLGTVICATADDAWSRAAFDYVKARYDRNYIETPKDIACAKRWGYRVVPVLVIVAPIADTLDYLAGG